MTDTTTADRLALLDLSYGYAGGIDRRERDVLLAVFHPDAVLRVYNPTGSPTPVTHMTGHAEIGVITDRIQRFPFTYHFVGNARFTVDGDTASGEIYGMAHHLTPGDEHGGTDYVMFMRYLDQYRRADDEWRISVRDAQVDWTETRFVDPTKEMR